ncbi:hypothetical protein SAMN05660479_02880 [Microbulbifer thermotolerans]|nr:hypothetical protein SAMN05660479_02880 [Microbulbifer thermotolerans]
MLLTQGPDQKMDGTNKARIFCIRHICAVHLLPERPEALLMIPGAFTGIGALSIQAPSKRLLFLSDSLFFLRLTQRL